MRRPALASVILFAMGMVLQILTDLHGLWGLVVCMGMLGVAGGAFAKAWEGVGAFALAFSLVLLGALYFGAREDQHVPLLYANRFLGHQVVLNGELVGEPEERPGGWRVEMQLRSVCLADTVWGVGGRVLIRFHDKIPRLAYGDHIDVSTVLTLPEPARNPGGFDYRQYLSLRGIWALAQVRRPSQLLNRTSGEGVWWMWCVLPMRQVIKGAIEQNLSGGPAGLLKGILLGDKQAIPSDLKETFTRCGINHVLAVSGLHVGLIAGVVFFGLRMVGMGRGITAGITLLLLLAYALVTGLPASVIRASVMAGLVIVGALGVWDADGWNALGVAGWVGLITQPTDILDIGFQLSFAATAGIMLFYKPVLAGLPKFGGHMGSQVVWGPLAVSLAAQITTLPLIVTTFGIVSVVGLVANLVIVPLVGLAAALGVISVLIFPLVPFVVTWLNGANWVVLKVVIFLAERMASVSWAALYVPHLPVYQWGIYALCVLLVLPRWRQRPYLPGVLTGVLLCANYAVWSPIFMSKHHLEMYVLDVGQGDGIFIRFPNGKTMLIDAGIRSQYADMGEMVVWPFLRSQGVTHVDVVIGSHEHSDHIGGLISVLDRVAVGHYLDSGQQASSWTAREVRRLVESKGVMYHEVAAGDSLVGLGNVGGLVLHPVPSFLRNDAGELMALNNGSVVLRLDYGRHSILLTGDIEHETDGALLRWQHRLQASILKAAHHGSRTSSTQAFLNGVRPTWVAVSCGINNKFRHPSPEVIDRYASMQAKVLRTDQSGAVRFVVSKTDVQVETWIK